MRNDDELDNLKIVDVNIAFGKSNFEFMEACIESGAQKSVIGIDQAEICILEVADRTSLRSRKAHEEKSLKIESSEQSLRRY